MYNSIDDIKREYDKLYLKHIDEYNNKREELYEKYEELENFDRKIYDLKIKSAIAKISGDLKLETDINNELNILIRDREKFINEKKINVEITIEYNCPICKDTGYVNGRKCQCFVDREIDMLKTISNFDKIAKDDTFKNLNLKFYNQDVFVDEGYRYSEYMASVISEIGNMLLDIKVNPLNIFMTGMTGTGKTFLSRCIGNAFLEKHKSVLYLSASDLISSVYDDNIKNYIYIVDLLIIDDLGTEYTNDFSNSQIYNVIDKRLVDKLSTVITTNLNFSEIQNLYGDRISSRIFNLYFKIKLQGSDLRGVL